MAALAVRVAVGQRVLVALVVPAALAAPPAALVAARCRAAAAP